ncbi:MAG TPA: hypothetical protein ENN81_00230 [Phycisphaerales bacterium]|nr:hypothetical protein [Phycisphaerales bacterium]
MNADDRSRPDVENRDGRSLEDRLAEAERLASLGRLMARVAHELNDPLDGMLRYVNMSIRCLRDGQADRPVEYLRRCREALIRMAQLSGQLLEFSRRSHSRAEFVNPEVLVEEALRGIEMRFTPPAAVKVVRDYGRDVPEIRAGNLYQVFSNIIKNAFDAMDAEGELVVTTRVEDKMVTVAFADTGCGFAEDDAERIFEPFFTTKPDGQGTGLGLAICREIMERCGGKIIGRPREGGGSVFTVCIPMTGNTRAVDSR